MTPKARKDALRKRGITQKRIAEELGVSEMSVSRVINGPGVSDRIMTYIAEKIGKPKHKVFPEYYLSIPKRKSSKAIGKINRYQAGSQCLNLEVKSTACN